MRKKSVINTAEKERKKIGGNKKKKKTVCVLCSVTCTQNLLKGRPVVFRGDTSPSSHRRTAGK